MDTHKVRVTAGDSLVELVEVPASWTSFSTETLLTLLLFFLHHTLLEFQSLLFKLEEVPVTRFLRSKYLLYKSFHHLLNFVFTNPFLSFFVGAGVPVAPLDG